MLTIPEREAFMSLLDALLLEEPTPPRSPTPRAIFIALRSDGAKGSGTETDPYDGSTRIGIRVEAEVVFNPLDVIVVIPGNSYTGAGFEAASTIEISKVTGLGACAYNRSFAGSDVEALTPYAFRLHLSAPPLSPPVRAIDGFATAMKTAPSPQYSAGVFVHWPVVRIDYPFAQYGVVSISGASDSSLNGEFVVVLTEGTHCWCLLTTHPDSAVSEGCTCASIRYCFDEVMSNATPNSLIHIGPGTFESRGGTQTYNSFELKTGQKIRGAGVDVTILRLVHAIGSTGHWLFSAPLSGGGLAHIEVSGLTFDLNVGGQPIPGGVGLSPVATAAVIAHGDHLRLEDIRAINWGTQSGPECFVLVLGQNISPIGNTVIENCIVEKPGENNTYVSSLLTMGSSDADAATGRSIIMRDNYLNCGVSNGFRGMVLVTAIERLTAQTALLTTSAPHRHVKWKNLVVRGALVGGSSENPYNGVFAITEIVSDTQLKYTMYADPGTNADVSAGVTIGHEISSEYVAIGDVGDYHTFDEFMVGDLLLGDFFLVDDYVTMSTKRPHNRTPGQGVALYNVNAFSHATAGFIPTVFNTNGFAYHTILSVDYDSAFSGSALSPNRFKIRLPDGVPPRDDLSLVSPRCAVLGQDSHALTMASGTGCLMERNQIYDAQVGFYTDTGASRDLILRDNCFSNVYFGVSEDLASTGNPTHGVDPTFGTPINAYSLVRDLTNSKRAIFTSANAHNLNDGDTVLITGASKDAYNGYFTIIVSPGEPNVFRYNLAEPQTLEPVNGAIARKQIASCISLPAANVARFTMPNGQPHGLLPGDAVDIGEALVDGSPRNDLNGTFTVKSVSPDWFEYEIATTPPHAMGGPMFKRRWQTKQLSIERNRIEIRSADENSYTSAAGISLYGHGFDQTHEPQSAYVFPHLLLRENLVGYIPGGGAHGIPQGSAVGVISVDGMVSAGNIIDVTTPPPENRMFHLYSKNMTYFNNLDSSGNLIRGNDWNRKSVSSALEDAIASAVLLAI